MNPLIEIELKNTKVAKIPSYEPTVEKILIQKGSRDVENIKFEVGKYYQVSLNNRLLDSNDSFVIFHSQWNKGNFPKENIMNVEILEVMGTAIKIHGVGLNSKTFWDGWLPIDEVKIINLL